MLCFGALIAATGVRRSLDNCIRSALGRAKPVRDGQGRQDECLDPSMVIVAGACHLHQTSALSTSTVQRGASSPATVVSMMDRSCGRSPDPTPLSGSEALQTDQTLSPRHDSSPSTCDVLEVLNHGWIPQPRQGQVFTSLPHHHISDALQSPKKTPDCPSGAHLPFPG